MVVEMKGKVVAAYVIQATDCGLDAEGAYCDVYEKLQYNDYDYTTGEWAPNGTTVDINCEDGNNGYGYDRPFSTYDIRGVWSEWRGDYGACMAYDDSDYSGDRDTEVQERKQTMPVYSKGGHQFYTESATRCEVGKGVYQIQRIRRGGDDFTTAAKSYTFTAVCDEPYPVYRREFKNAAGTARLGVLVAALAVATALLLL